MNKYELEKKLVEFFKIREDILFAYIFGSFLTRNNYRDIDIAVFFRENPGLLELGKIHTELIEITKKEVDVIALNGLPQKSPVMAFHILSTGKLVKNIDEDSHVNYKELMMRYYFDTTFLRAQMNKAFEKRMDHNVFGKRDFLLE